MRKKAVMALLRFYHLSPTSVPNLSDKVRRSLCDADPSVMSASLNLVECLVEVRTAMVVTANCVIEADATFSRNNHVPGRM